jgi:hypothetical protein
MHLLRKGFLGLVKPYVNVEFGELSGKGAWESDLAKLMLPLGF